jgi:sulfate adenylyltransferase subunit 1
MSWYTDGTLLSHLETIPISRDYNLSEGRFPVQYILRPESDEFHDYRGYSGRVAGGVFRPGDRVMVLPSRISTVITSIDTFNGPLQEAFPPLSVTLRLKDDIDISRGNMIVQEEVLPKQSSDLEVMICWMSHRPLQPDGKYFLKHTTADVRCIIRDVNYILNISTLEHQTEIKTVKLNDIASILIHTTQPLFFDPYSRNRFTGSLILIDEGTHETVAAGMIL